MNINEKKKQTKKRNEILLVRILLLLKSNLLLFFSEGYVQNLLDDLEYFNNLLKKCKYKENETIMMKNSLLKII